MSRLTVDSFFNFRSRVTDSIEWGKPGNIFDDRAYTQFREYVSRGVARKFVADLFFQIWREKYSINIFLLVLFLYVSTT